MILDVPAGKDTRDARFGPVLRDDVPSVVHAKLPAKEGGVWAMSDGDEHPVDWEVGLFLGLQILETDLLYPGRLISQDLGNPTLPLKGDLGIRECPFLHDLRGPELISPVDHRYLAAQLGEIQGLFHGRIPSPDHHHLLVLKEVPVAGGAGRDPPPHEPLFRLEAQQVGGSSGSDDESPAVKGLPLGLHGKRAYPEVHLGRLPLEDPRPEALRLLLHLFHQLWPHNPIREGGIVFHHRGGGELAARLGPSDERGLKIGSRRIESRGVARRSRTDYDNSVKLHATLLTKILPSGTQRPAGRQTPPPIFSIPRFQSRRDGRGKKVNPKAISLMDCPPWPRRLFRPRDCTDLTARPRRRPRKPPRSGPPRRRQR